MEKLQNFCEIMVSVLKFAKSTRNVINKDWKSLNIQRLLSDWKYVKMFTNEVVKIFNVWDSTLIGLQSNYYHN